MTYFNKNILSYLIFIFLSVFPEQIYSQNTECPSIPTDAVNIKKTGQKSWDKCIDYIDLIYPCESSGTRRENCISKTNGDDKIINEYPHIAILGYENEDDTILWNCAGTLISERWVLTRNICTRETQTDADVKYVKFGNEKISNTKIISKYIYEVDEIVVHPDYVDIRPYDNIALLKLKKDVDILNIGIIPACLHVGNSLQNKQIIETSWIKNDENDTNIEIIRNSVEILNDDECSQTFRPNYYLKEGVRNATQFCAKEIVPAEKSGGVFVGVLQVKNSDVFCMYTVIGIHSIVISDDDLYSRVSGYLPWIEKIVWP